MSDSYLVKFTVGNIGEPGAPILHVSAVVDAATGKLNGSGEITQAIEGPQSKILLRHITGEFKNNPAIRIFRVLTLEGSFVTPPTAVVQGFSADLEIGTNNHEWSGTGTFTYGTHTVTGPLKSIPTAVSTAV